jgi:hypothetical protein
LTGPDNGITRGLPLVRSNSDALACKLKEELLDEAH